MSNTKKSAKSSGYISELQREIDQFKFQIDDLCENELPQLGAASPDRLSIYKRTNSLKSELSVLNQKLNGLSVSNEKISIKKFESKRDQEKQRLYQLKSKLDDISNQLEPDEVEEDYFRTLNSNAATEDEQEDRDEDKRKNRSPREQYEYGENDEDEDDDSEKLGNGYDDEEIGSGHEIIVCYAEALTTFHAEQDGDLSFDKGDHLIILEKSEDGWWFAKNEEGKRGVVPNTLIKVVEEKDLRKAAEKQNGREDHLEASKSGRDLWDKLKEKKPATKEESIIDVLKAMKAAPAGFRSPTLGTWYKKESYRVSTWVVPKRSPSKLQFQDLHWDAIDKKLREYPVKVTRAFSLVVARCIPPIGAGVEVLSRHVYVALWDEEKIVSNIHLIRAVPLERDLSWTFTPKFGKSIPTLYDGDFVVRCDKDYKNLSILFELNYTYRRISTSQQIDISCGWASLPLLQADGTPIPNKNFELTVNGGTPFEKDIPLDPSINIAANQSLMQSLIRSNQQPRIIVKSTSINRVSKDTYDMLPETIVTCQKYAPFIGHYRQHAAMVFCREEKIPCGWICDPILAYFPRALNFPDLMDSLKSVWDEKSRTTLSRSQRKNPAQLQVTFKQSFIESAFGLMQCANIPGFTWADSEAEKARHTFIQSFLIRKDPLGNLLSPDFLFKPLDINKVAFSVMTKHSSNPAPLNRECIART